MNCSQCETEMEQVTSEGDYQCPSCGFTDSEVNDEEVTEDE